jgi:uncharacterized protein with GYD domain
LRHQRSRQGATLVQRRRVRRCAAAPQRRSRQVRPPVDARQKPNRAWHAEKRAMFDDLAQSPQVGGDVRDVWWTLGLYDLVIEVQVRDQVAAHAFSLTLSRKLKADVTAMSTLRDADVDPVFDFLEIRNGP